MLTEAPESGDESFDEPDEDPHSLDFIDWWRLENEGDHERLDEHRFSIDLNVANAVCIFSSSNVIRAFCKRSWKWKKMKTGIKQSHGTYK